MSILRWGLVMGIGLVFGKLIDVKEELYISSFPICPL